MCSKPFQALLQLDEDAEVGELGDLALLDVAAVVAARDVAFPRIVGHLLEAQGDAFAFLIDVEDDALDLVALVAARRDGWPTLRTQLMSLTCSRPSMPSSISMKAP